MVAVNVRAVFHTASLCVNFLKEREGTITILSAASGEQPSASHATFSISKSMDNMFIKCAALELAYHKIRVNGVAPGLTWGHAGSDSNDPSQMSQNKQENDQFYKLYNNHIPLDNVFNDAEDVANAIVWLASDEASYINGEIMNIDGGYKLTAANYPMYFD